MLRVFSPIGFDFIFTPNALVLNHGFLGLQDFTDDRWRFCLNYKVFFCLKICLSLIHTMTMADKYKPGFYHRRLRQFWQRLARIYTHGEDKKVEKPPFLWNMEKTIH